MCTLIIASRRQLPVTAVKPDRLLVSACNLEVILRLRHLPRQVGQLEFGVRLSGVLTELRWVKLWQADLTTLASVLLPGPPILRILGLRALRRI